MQLDIFEHSRDTMLRNDVALALERRDAAAAQQAWLTLADEFPLDGALPALSCLIDALAHAQHELFADHATLRAARSALADSTEPAAVRVFGAAAGASWSMPLRRELAQRAAPLPFDAEHADDHAAPLWLHAGNWQAAADAVARIASWRRIPAPLGWMAEARHRLGGTTLAWPLLAELAWLAPARLDSLTKRLPDPPLQRLRQRFDASFEPTGEGHDLAWFPAWLLTEQAALAPLLGQAQAGQHSLPEAAFRLLLELLGLERQGRQHELVAKRRALRDTHAGLYAAYLKTR